jgi:hypothetical protein
MSTGVFSLMELHYLPATEGGRVFENGKTFSTNSAGKMMIKKGAIEGPRESSSSTKTLRQHIIIDDSFTAGSSEEINLPSFSLTPGSPEAAELSNLHSNLSPCSSVPCESPFKSNNGDAAQQKVRMSVSPEHIAAAAPPDQESTEPDDPESTEPQEPESTEPQEPESTEPQEPESTEPQEPESTEPQEPESTELQEPESTEPQEPESTEPEEPESTEPEEPASTPDDEGSKMTSSPKVDQTSRPVTSISSIDFASNLWNISTSQTVIGTSSSRASGAGTTKKGSAGRTSSFQALTSSSRASGPGTTVGGSAGGASGPGTTEGSSAGGVTGPGTATSQESQSNADQRTTTSVRASTRERETVSSTQIQVRTEGNQNFTSVVSQVSQSESYSNQETTTAVHASTQMTEAVFSTQNQALTSTAEWNEMLTSTFSNVHSYSNQVTTTSARASMQETESVSSTQSQVWPLVGSTDSITSVLSQKMSTTKVSLIEWTTSASTGNTADGASTLYVFVLDFQPRFDFVYGRSEMIVSVMNLPSSIGCDNITCDFKRYGTQKCLRIVTTNQASSQPTSQIYCRTPQTTIAGLTVPFLNIRNLDGTTIVDFPSNFTYRLPPMPQMVRVHPSSANIAVRISVAVSLTFFPPIDTLSDVLASFVWNDGVKSTVATVEIFNTTAPFLNGMMNTTDIHVITPTGAAARSGIAVLNIFHRTYPQYVASFSGFEFLDSSRPQITQLQVIGSMSVSSNLRVAINRGQKIMLSIADVPVNVFDIACTAVLQYATMNVTSIAAVLNTGTTMATVSVALSAYPTVGPQNGVVFFGSPLPECTVACCSDQSCNEASACRNVRTACFRLDFYDDTLPSITSLSKSSG